MQHQYIDYVYSYAVKKRELLIPYLKGDKHHIPEHFLYPNHLMTTSDTKAYCDFMLMSINDEIDFHHYDVINRVDAELQNIFGVDFHQHMIMFALALATYLHGDPEAVDHARNTGEPYIEHPLEVYYIISQVTNRYADLNEFETVMVLSATLLHDTIEGTKATVELLEIIFGRDTAYLVCGCSKTESLIDYPLPLSVLNPDHSTTEHYVNGSEHVQNIKTADAIHNISCFERDNPKYAPVYAERKSKLHVQFLKADKHLMSKLMNLIHGKVLA